MASRPFISFFGRQLCPSRRLYASRAGFTNKQNNGRPLRNMPKRPKDPEVRQKRADRLRQDAIDNIPSILDPMMPISNPDLANEATKSVENYVIERTPTSNFPIYQSRKRGGNLKLTKVRKIEGDREALRRELELCLVPKPEYVELSSVTGHIDIKGWYKFQIEKILLRKGF